MLAAILLLAPQFVFASAPRLVINQLVLSASMVNQGESMESISVQLQNAGDADCSDGEVQIFFADSDNVLVPGIPVLTKSLIFYQHEWKTVLFSVSDPPAPNVSSLSVGTFGAIARVSCKSSVQDEKIAFFSVREKSDFNIPEIQGVSFLLLVAGITALLFMKRK